MPWPAVLVVSELPPGRLPVRLFTAPVTEPRPVVPVLPVVPVVPVAPLLSELLPGTRLLLLEPTLLAVVPWLAPVTEPTWGSELVWGVLVPETRPAADPRSGMEPETELRPGRELLVLLRLPAGPLVVAIGMVCWVVPAELVSAELVSEELVPAELVPAESHGAPATPAAAEASGPAMGMPGRSQRTPEADDPPRT